VGGKAAAFQERLGNSSRDLELGNSSWGIRAVGFAGLPWGWLSFKGKPALRAAAVPSPAVLINRAIAREQSGDITETREDRRRAAEISE